MPQDTRYQEITKELYSKNLDLLNANKTLELIQKLYEIMISSFSVESVSQHFIDLITQSLGFADGLVAIHNEKNSHLSVSGITQTQLNMTALELIGIPTVDIRYETEYDGNALIRSYKTGQSAIVSSLTQVWTPYLKPEDLVGITTLVGVQNILVYPIIFGEKILGSFYLTMGNGSKELTTFERKALDRIITVFGIAIDRIRINQELRASELRELSKTKELLKLKDEFVFIATHDLKTPVTAINGFVELIEKDAETFSPHMKENFSAIKDSSHRLMQLTTDLLEVARSESGTITMELQDIDIAEALERGITQITPSAQKRNIVIKTTINMDHTMARADKTRIAEVIENLLSNAVKYNKDGGTIHVGLQPIAGGIAVSIADTGIGIPADQQEKVFQKFFRARQKGTEDIVGTGLGLFVVRMLVEKMNGTISFTSTEGVGTTFVFTLKVA